MEAHHNRRAFYSASSACFLKPRRVANAAEQLLFLEISSYFFRLLIQAGGRIGRALILAVDSLVKPEEK
jgi:hypothetical protein